MKNTETQSQASLPRMVGQRTCMVIADRELCENKAEWRVRSHKHRFDLHVCHIHGKAFLGMKGVDVEPLSNVEVSDQRGREKASDCKPDSMRPL